MPDGVGDAVGIGKSQWYVAIVKHNTEKSCASKLENLHIEHYLPSQTEYKVWKNGRKAKVERVVIPSTIFIRCTEAERREIVKLPFINRFMTNKSGTTANYKHKPLAIIPEVQIEEMKFMLGQSEMPVEIIGHSLKNGDRVRIIRGYLTGLEGIVLNMKSSKSDMYISINIFGYARLFIDTVNLIKI